MKNIGGRGGVIVNQISDEEICPDEHHKGFLFHQ
jgi:hypothetical protein